MINKIFTKNTLILSLLFLLMFLLRIAGITWGFPATLHNDESVTIRSALGMRFGNLNPNHFDWPSLYFYINYFFFWVFIKIRIQLQLIFGVEFLKTTFPFWWGPDLPFYFIGRLISAIFSTLTGVVLYQITKYIFKDKKYQILAVTLYAFSFYSIYYSYYALSDNALAFFMLFATLFSLKVLQNKKWINYFLAGSMVGLATSTKYHGVASALSVICANYLASNSSRVYKIINVKLLLAGFFSIVFFVITTPYSLLDFETFSVTENATGAFWQLSHMGKGINWGYYIFQSLPKSHTLLGVFLAFIGLYLAFKNKKKFIILLAVQFIGFFLYIGTWGILRPHYSIPLIPYLVVLISYSLYKINISAKNQTIFIFLCACLLFRPTVDIAYEIICRNNTDTRILAGKWIEKNIPKNSVILIEGSPTKYYGGDNPIFRWEDYKMENIEDPSKKVITRQNVFSIETDKTNKSNFSSQNRKGCVLYEGKFRTGPDILICKN